MSGKARLSMNLFKSSGDVTQRSFLFLNERKVPHAIPGDTSRLPEINTDLHLRTGSYLDFPEALKDFCSSKDIPTAGLHVAFLGPDGSGKSSVIKRIMPDLAQAFSDTACIHLLPGIGRKKGDNRPVTDPHGQAPRGLPASVAKIVYLWCDYFLGWCLTVWPKTVRSTLVVFDRYYHDILVDPRRYRYRGPIWLARWVGKLIPKPELWILLDAPAEVLQERKQEVSFEETARQRENYLKLIRGMKNGVVVDASRDLNDVVTDVNLAILNFMAKRTEKRLGL